MVRLFKNVRVVDGTGGSIIQGDVLVRDDTVMAVGSFPSYRADEVVYGHEGYLTPGFIDPHVNSDKYLTLFSSPGARDFVSQGVTSGIIGHCGFSLAPLLYDDLLSHARWSKDALNISWKGVSSFLSMLDGMGLGINIGTLVGHHVLRDSIVHNPSVFSKLSANELRIIRSLLTKALDEGALGFSLGLGYKPYTDTSYYEARALCDVVSGKKGVCGVHLRNEKEGVGESLQEVVRLSRDTSAQMIVSHFRPFKGFEKAFEGARDLLASSFEKDHIFASINPFPHSSVSIDEILPPDLHDDDRGAFIQRLEDDSFAKKVERFFPPIDASKTYIVSVPHMDFLNGVPLYNFAKERGLSTAAALVELMRISRLKAVVLYENLSQEHIDDMLFSPYTLIASNSPHIDSIRMHKPPRAYATFTAYLQKAQERGENLEKVIRKVTGLVAELYHFQRRGIIKSGARADLVLFSKDMKPQQVYVNGECVLKDGEYIEQEGRGRTLRSS